MLRYILAVLMLIGCSSSPLAEPVGEAQDLLSCSSPTCRGGVTNGVASLPSENTYLCHPIMISGSGAHSQSPILTWGVPAWGSSVGVSASQWSPSMSAIPNARAQGMKQGQAVVEVQCDRWTRFAAGAGNGYSQEFSFNWNDGNTLQFVSGDAYLWDIQSVCWLSGIGSFSATGEQAWLDVPNEWNWRHNVQGYKTYSSTSRCAWLGRVQDWNQSVWLDTTVANPHDSGMPVDEGTCFFYYLSGNFDDGRAHFTRPNGTWQLVADGDVQAKGYCIRYN